MAVYSFQKKLMNLLRNKLEVTFIQYFSDGCSRQYKNKKNFLNLVHHQLDFGVQADWAFSATSHGKGPWDGLAGSAKHEATIESLRRPLEKQIQTADDFFMFVRQKFKNIHVKFISSESIQQLEQDILEERFKKVKVIKGTQQFHSFMSLSDNQKVIKVKRFSLSSQEKLVNVSKT